MVIRKHYEKYVVLLVDNPDAELILLSSLNNSEELHV
jgi:hypothetical protein